MLLIPRLRYLVPMPGSGVEPLADFTDAALDSFVPIVASDHVRQPNDDYNRQQLG